MQMIGHDDVIAQFDLGADVAGEQPFFADDFPELVQHHRVIFNMAKPTAALVGANRQEISARLRVIIITQPKRTALSRVGLRWAYHAKPIRSRCALTFASNSVTRWFNSGSGVS